MTLADYLAKNYLSTDSKPSKKRKRKATTADASAGITITDDDILPQSNPTNGDLDDDDDPTVVSNVLTSGLNAPKKSKWLRIGTSAPKDADQVTADAILASAQAESAARQRAQADEDGPQIVDNDDDDDDGAVPIGGPTMTSGAAAGLQTAAQVTAALRRKEKAEKAAMREAGLDATGITQQTIYRDASGRVINVQHAREEAARKAEAEAQKAKDEVQSRLGDVQRREKEERRRALEDAKTMTFARGADDAEMNEELKRRERWNDPMAQLLAAKKGKGLSGKAKGGKTYQGAAEPNRYGIRPGWRWDGVDRGNGFERKWFAARNKAKDRQDLEYAWQMDE